MIKTIKRWEGEYPMMYESWINDKHPHLITNGGENLDMEEQFEEDYLESLVDEKVIFTD